jgi:hypothetical protein
MHVRVCSEDAFPCISRSSEVHVRESKLKAKRVKGLTV